MAVELRVFKKTLRIIFVYLLHIGHERRYFHDIVNDIEFSITDTIDMRLVVVRCALRLSVITFGITSLALVVSFSHSNGCNTLFRAC